jgi:hypothetical protein
MLAWIAAHQPDQGRQPGAGRAVPPPGHGRQARGITGPALRRSAHPRAGRRPLRPGDRRPRRPGAVAWPKRSIASPKPFRSSEAPGHTPATPRRGATTASATSRCNPSHPPDPGMAGHLRAVRARGHRQTRRRLDPLAGIHASRGDPCHAGPDRRRRRSGRPTARPDPRHPQHDYPHRPGSPAAARRDHRPAKQVVSQLRDLPGLGFTGFNFILSGPGRIANMRRITEEVLPVLRSTAEEVTRPEMPPMGAFAVKRACWSVPVTWRSPGSAVVLAFFAAAVFRAVARSGVKLEVSAPAAGSARQGAGEDGRA